MAPLGSDRSELSVLSFTAVDGEASIGEVAVAEHIFATESVDPDGLTLFDPLTVEDGVGLMGQLDRDDPSARESGGRCHVLIIPYG